MVAISRYERENEQLTEPRLPLVRSHPQHPQPPSNLPIAAIRANEAGPELHHIAQLTEADIFTLAAALKDNDTMGTLMLYVARGLT